MNRSVGVNLNKEFRHLMKYKRSPFPKEDLESAYMEYDHCDQKEYDHHHNNDKQHEMFEEWGMKECIYASVGLVVSVASLAYVLTRPHGKKFSMF
jgi:hypothetical protein